MIRIRQLSAQESQWTLTFSIYGDNLDILRKYIRDESVDLVYLDPPFNSKATYNVLYKELSGQPSKAQVTAFEDTWEWSLESEAALSEIASSVIGSHQTKQLVSVLPDFVGQRTPKRAYLTMMAVRLVELRRVLKDIKLLFRDSGQELLLSSWGQNLLYGIRRYLIRRI